MLQTIQVGRLGPISFNPGQYAYVGSAMGGLEKRLTRYLKEIARPHWHIDALIPIFRLTSIWVFPSSQRQECQIARILSRVSGIAPVPGFGCTDCQCTSHLFDITCIKTAPLFEKLKGALRCESAQELICS